MNTERYQRQLVLPDFGSEGQKKLGNAKIVVVGAGGLGTPVLQYLVGMGVGHIRIIDSDVVSLSNLQRQVIYSTNDVGKKKVEVAQSLLNKLNPEVELEPEDKMLTRDNASNLLKGFDVVVDCTDSIESRYIINDTCEQLNIPFVYGSLYRHEGHVAVFNYHGSVNYRDVYPDDSAKVENCNEIGVLGVLPGIIGSYQAMEVVKIVAGIGEPLAGKLLVVNALETEHHVFQLSKNLKKEKRKVVIEPIQELLSWQELDDINTDDYHLLDVRPENAFQTSHDPRFENVPMETLAEFKPSDKKDIVLVCQRGNTTKQAFGMLKANFPEKAIYQISGGYNTQ